MKILTAHQIKALDQFTIENEPISSISLMERASLAFCNWLISKFNNSHSILVVAGTGNNGGDGLAIARILRKEGYSLKVMVVGNPETGTSDFKENLNNLPKDIPFGLVTSELDFKDFPESDIIIDAIFGSGLNRPLAGTHIPLVRSINERKNTNIIAVDIPSGMFSDQLNSPSDVIINAHYTVTFQVPKFSFFLLENERHVGDWSVVDIGIKEENIEKHKTEYEFILKEDIQPKVKVRSKFSHKGTYGHALLVAGSYGKIGAAVMASRACLRTGVGLLTVQVPECGYDIVQSSVPEAMCLTDPSARILTTLFDLNPYQAVGMGPGIGKDSNTVQLLENILKSYKRPVVLDADALNILSENPHLIQLLPEGSILTPHPKEFERLAGKADDSVKRLHLLREFCIKNKCITILKGAYSAICSTNGKIFFNSTGNPGMATGGSGDVLTGIITSLLAQGYNPIDAAVLGVYLHGYAGDSASKKLGFESLIASDIIEEIFTFFKEITSK